MSYRFPTRRYSVLALVVIVKAISTIALLGCNESTTLVAEPIDASQNTDDEELQDFIRATYVKAVNDPESALLRGRLGMIYDANGFHDAAIETYRQAYELDSEDARWPYLESLALGTQGRLREALHSMNLALEIDSTYVASHLAKGFWLMDLGDFEGACESFDDAARINTLSRDHIAINAGRAQCNLELGDLDAAARALDSISTEQLPRYVELLQARIYRAQGKSLPNGLAIASKDSKDQPSWSDPIAGAVVEYTRGLSGETLLAQELIEGGRAADALPLITSLIERYQAESHLIELHSSALIALNRIDEAIDALNNGLSEFPASHLIRFNLASLLESTGQFDKALSHYEGVIDSKSDFIPAYDAQVGLLLQKGATSNARGVLRASLEYRQPDWNTYYRLGVLDGALGNWEESVRNFSYSIELAPRNSDAYANMALSLGELKRTDEAKNAITRARAFAPDSPKVKRAMETLIANGVLEGE